MVRAHLYSMSHTLTPLPCSLKIFVAVGASPAGIEPMTILGGPPYNIFYITPTILRLIRAGPPIPPMIVLKHGELR